MTLARIVLAATAAHGLYLAGILFAFLQCLLGAAADGRRSPNVGDVDRHSTLAELAPAVETSLPANPAARAARADFDAVWHAGRAEVDGYRLTVERYGHPRSGRGVLVYVTEPFSRSRHVKVDDPSANPADT